VLVRSADDRHEGQIHNITASHLEHMMLGPAYTLTPLSLTRHVARKTVLSTAATAIDVGIIQRLKLLGHIRVALLCYSATLNLQLSAGAQARS
jgi:hypothetical protein